MRYRLEREATVTLALNDALGRKARPLTSAEKQATHGHETTLQAEGLSSGVYFARLVAETEGRTVTRTRKLVLIC